MIQRLQTLFLLLFCGINAANYFLFPVEYPLLNSTFETEAALLVKLPLVFALVLFINVFLYKHRNQQLLINRVVWVVFTLFWGIVVYLIVQQGKEFSPYLADLGLAFVGEVALLMANRYIAKDEALIRSLDRLR